MARHAVTEQLDDRSAVERGQPPVARHPPSDRFRLGIGGAGFPDAPSRGKLIAKLAEADHEGAKALSRVGFCREPCPPFTDGHTKLGDCCVVLPRSA